MRRGIVTSIAVAVLALVSWCGAVAAQTKTIYIQDDHGNQAVGTIIDGNVFFHDNSGNIAVGTIKNGNVFLDTNSGEAIFGTVKNGNVFLTDRTGITTGTIQNGNIFLRNGNGSTTTGTYDHSGHFQTSTTPPADTSTTTQQQMDAHNQAEYNAGYGMGQAAGSIILVSIERHKLRKFCKKNPTAIYKNSDGYFSGTLCPEAPFDREQQASINKFCNGNPGRDTSIGLHTVKCVNPPSEPNLKWAEWEMKGLRRDYRAQKALNSPGADQARLDWLAWSSAYCRLGGTKSTYKDLDGKKRHCH